MSSVMFNEALQDLKDRFRDRLTLIHVLSRQAQEVDLLQGRIDGAKVRSDHRRAAAGGQHGRGLHLRPRRDDHRHRDAPWSRPACRPTASAPSASPPARRRRSRPIPSRAPPRPPSRRAKDIT
jgi:hypothetical protein